MSKSPLPDPPPEEPDAIEEPAADDPVDTWGQQSFPASDPPQWWCGTIGKPD